MLHCMCWNVGVLSAAKQQHVQELVAGPVNDEHVSLFVLCEIGRSQHSFAGFTGYYGLTDPRRSARGGGRGQGLGVFVRDELGGLTTLVKQSHHYVWVKVHVPGRIPLYVCGVYLPPSGSDT